MTTPIYKILRADEWAALREHKRTDGSSADIADGFIHFSTPPQLPGTLSRYYVDAGEVILAKLIAENLGEGLLWEPARDGSLFPHLYGPLKLSDIVRHWVLTPDAGGDYTLPGFDKVAS